MTLIEYVPKKFGASALAVIDTANAIIEDYQEQGYDLTLRQLYYQFVARDLLPNRDQSYKRLGSIISDARLAGLVSWHAIVDRTRNTEGDYSGFSITHERLIKNAARGYFEDLWADQPARVEVWVEKEALAGVVERAASGLRCAHFPNRGYVSQSAMWEAAQRMVGYVNEGKDAVILHLGDHDPSGIDMTRDITDRMDLFVGEGLVEVKRIALNMDQIERYSPPPNPAKITDSRSQSYISRFGQQSWELDALDPSTLNTLIQNEVRHYMDEDAWGEATQHERSERAKVVAVADRWPEIVAFLGEGA